MGECCIFSKFPRLKSYQNVHMNFPSVASKMIQDMCKINPKCMYAYKICHPKSDIMKSDVLTFNTNYLLSLMQQWV